MEEALEFHCQKDQDQKEKHLKEDKRKSILFKKHILQFVFHHSFHSLSMGFRIDVDMNVSFKNVIHKVSNNV